MIYYLSLHHNFVMHSFHKTCPYAIFYLSIRFYNSCRRLPETKLHSSLFLHLSGSKFLVVMAACTPSIHVFLGRPLFLLSSGIHSIINFGILSSGILLTWPYHCSLFFSVMSMMSGCPFTPITSSHDNKKFRTRSVEKQRGMAFGFRKTATAVVKPDR